MKTYCLEFRDDYLYFLDDMIMLVWKRSDGADDMIINDSHICAFKRYTNGIYSSMHLYNLMFRVREVIRINI